MNIDSATLRMLIDAKKRITNLSLAHGADEVRCQGELKAFNIVDSIIKTLELNSVYMEKPL